MPVDEHVRVILKTADARLADRVSPSVVAALVDAYARPALLVPPAVDDGALAALEALGASGHTLAVVSNTMRTPGTALRKLLAHYGLLRHFAHTCFSDEIGIRKPDPEIFMRTLGRVAGHPATAVHVGDDPILDVQGALAAGMRVIQVTGERSPGRIRHQPTATIPRLSALPGAIAALDTPG